MATDRGTGFPGLRLRRRDSAGIEFGVSTKVGERTGAADAVGQGGRCLPTPKRLIEITTVVRSFIAQCPRVSSAAKDVVKKVFVALHRVRHPCPAHRDFLAVTAGLAAAAFGGLVAALAGAVRA